MIELGGSGVPYEDATDALNALKDYGCLHIDTPIILGVSVPAYSPEELERLNRENSKLIEIDGYEKTGYGWKQTMRRLETEARKTRDQMEILKASGDKKGVKQLHEKLNTITDKYTKVSQATGIKAQYEKMAIVKAKSVDKTVESGIIREAERMKSSIEYAVKKDLTNSSEFVRKFDKITDDKELRREFYGEAKEMLHHRSGTDGEDLKIYNPRLKKWYRSIDGIESGTPEYNDEILCAFAENKGNEIIAFHNHPMGMPPSASDLNAALKNRYAKGYTIGHDGKIFEYTAPKCIISESVYNVRISKYLDLGYTEYNAQCAALNDLSTFYGFTYKEVEY